MLLDDERCYPYIHWIDKPNGHFKVVNSKVVSKLWGLRKNNPEMKFETMARALRYYYQKGILSKVDGQRLVYRFVNIPARDRHREFINFKKDEF
ncbi:hypothetical protein O3M35_003351 [Rhynocoris fuscipes]|uniref:ETS domain-containing protein n=1 Tax=Rhynocoris fuscipes TaxID=488301 RepID=A0AAW1CMP0_9HEMI